MQARIKRPVPGWEAGAAGEKLKAWRKSGGLSQQAAAIKLGISISKLQKIERGAQGIGPEIWASAQKILEGS